MTTLRHHLFQAFGGFADPRYRDPSQDHPIKIDDQHARDRYRYFCIIRARVREPQDDCLILTLHHPPCDGTIVSVVEEYGGWYSRSEQGPTLTLTIRAYLPTPLSRLSQAFRRLIDPGQRYSDSNWTWLCPRTAGSLDRLLAYLMAYNALRSCERLSQAWPPRSQAPSLSWPDSSGVPDGPNLPSGRYRPFHPRQPVRELQSRDTGTLNF